MPLVKRLSRLLAILTAVALLAPVLCSRAFAETDGVIRVKLTRLGAPQKISMIANCDYMVNGDSDMTIKSGTAFSVVNSSGTLRLERGDISLGMGASFTLKRAGSGQTGIKFTSPALTNVYAGDLALSASSGAVVGILSIYVESYLYGVVGCEMSPSNPEEALKAQAVAARTYALRQKAARKSAAFDVTDSTSNQVFQGYNSAQTTVVAAVDATAGQTLKYNGDFAACFYSSSNGGQTESTKNAWGSSLKYSVVKDDPYDLASGATAKSTTIYKDARAHALAPELSAYLKNGMAETLARYNLSAAHQDIEIISIDSIVPVSPRYAEPSKVYRYLRFTVSASSVDMSGARVTGSATVDVPTFGGVEDWFALSINSTDNETVWVDVRESSYVVTFRRSGHGVGMSQRGARTMARENMSCAQILEFYYPGTTLSRDAYADPSGSGAVEPPIEVPDNAAPQTAYVKLSTASGTLNLRASASMSAKVITGMPNGARVSLYSTSGDWSYIEYSGRRGYAAARYLAYVQEAPDTPAIPETPEAPEAGAAYARVALSSSSSRLNLRYGPSASSDVVAKLPHGKYLKLLSESGGWARVATVEGASGYVSSRYITRVSVEGGAEFAEYTAYLKLGAFSDRMNLRAGAGTDTEILAVLQCGMYLTVTGETGEWSHVSTLSGTTGCVKTKYLTREQPNTADFVVHNAGGRLFDAYVTENAYLRSAPSAASYSPGAAEIGAPVTVYAYNDKWAYVKCGDIHAYISISCLRKADQ